MATTSCEVMPAGLSTSSNPPASGAGVTIGRGFRSGRFRRLRVLDARQQVLDARGVSDALVGAERDLRREAQAKRAPDPGAKVPRGTGESVERRRALGIGAHDTDEHFRMS